MPVLNFTLLESSQEKPISQLQEETRGARNAQYREAKELEICLVWLKLHSLSKEQTV